MLNLVGKVNGYGGNGRFAVREAAARGVARLQTTSTSSSAHRRRSHLVTSAGGRLAWKHVLEIWPHVAVLVSLRAVGRLRGHAGMQAQGDHLALVLPTSDPAVRQCGGPHEPGQDKLRARLPVTAVDVQTPTATTTGR